MDGLEAFEKNLAAEQAERERTKRHSSHHHHRHTHSHRDKSHRSSRTQEDSSRRSVRHHDDGDDGDRQRRKRRRRSHDQEELQSGSRHGGYDHSHVKTTDPKADLPFPDEEKPSDLDNLTGRKSMVRDAWMTTPSAIDFESVHGSDRKPSSVPKPEEKKRFVHSREMNDKHLQALNDSIAPPDSVEALSKPVDYTFGDAGSSWRMTKLRAVYNMAEETGQDVEEIALQRYGSLKDSDDAREEKNELERRKIYGEGYKEEKPTGELYHERLRNRPSERHLPVEPQQTVVIPEETPTEPPPDQTTLNRLRAQIMKAKLRRAPDAAKLEQEYERVAAAAAANESSTASEAVILGVMDSRQLAGHRGEVKAVETKRGRRRGKVEENSDMTIEDMVREERRTKGQAGGEGMRLAKRIAKDTKYDNDLDYMDENAEKLAKRVHKNELSLKNMAVNEYQKMSQILDKCSLCYHEDTGRAPIAPVISLATRVYLTLATAPEVSPGGAVIIPISHRTNLLECDDDEWEEIRNFMKSLMRLYHEQGRDVLFYENAANPRRRPHAAMVAVPIPYEEGATAPAHFKEAFLTAEDEWSQHRKVIDTGARARDGLGRMAFRRSLAKGMPYFHVWFGLDGGLGHVVEEADRWPRGDLFAREVIGGIVGAEPHVVKKQGRWTAADPRLEEWKRGWRKFDWTRVLTEQGAS